MPYKHKILLTETKDFSKDVIEYLKTFSDVEIAENFSQENLKSSLQNYDVVWIRFGFKVTKNDIPENPRCRFIAINVTGTDHLDEKSCNGKGIKILSLKGESEFLKNIRATAELTVTLTLALIRNVISAYESVKQGIWNRDLFRGTELYGKTAGIIGYGRLGKIVAGYFKAFGMNVCAYDINNDVDFSGAEKVSLNELLKNSDVVSLHVNYKPENENMFAKSEFDLMKKNSVFINTARGGLVDEDALLEALKSKKIRGAAIDVLKNEFNANKENKLIEYMNNNDNLIIVPHIGGNTYESFYKTEMFIAQKIKKELGG
ncbi:MAG TPA: NAD(P)-dependent oxidoreductase [Ignavibacteria bacterium]|nr:NAD(P)-dependent oxidoreductase [Ignavibacteria bacterium]